MGWRLADSSIPGFVRHITAETVEKLLTGLWISVLSGEQVADNNLIVVDKRGLSDCVLWIRFRIVGGFCPG